MHRIIAIVVFIVVPTGVTPTLWGQISPSGFQDPAGANRGGTGNPPNAPLAPLGGSTLPPGAPAMPREIETNPALRQEVRHPFGSAIYPHARGTGDEGEGENTPKDPAKGFNFSERQNTGHDEGFVDNTRVGPATGKLASDWRYAYFQGRHWYWMPNETWDVWNGTAWVPHKSGMFGRAYFGYGTQVRGYRSLPRGYNGSTYGQPLTRSTQPDREGTERNDRYTGPLAGTSSALTGTSGGVTAVPGANAPNARRPQVNQAEVERALANQNQSSPRTLTEQEVIQGPFDIEEPEDAQPAATTLQTSGAATP
jgi:hypothetical protein